MGLPSTLLHHQDDLFTKLPSHKKSRHYVSLRLPALGLGIQQKTLYWLIYAAFTQILAGYELTRRTFT